MISEIQTFLKTGAKFKDIERATIIAAVHLNDGSPSRAAEQLGISVRKIQYRMKQYKNEEHELKSFPKETK